VTIYTSPYKDEILMERNMETYTDAGIKYILSERLIHTRAKTEIGREMKIVGRCFSTVFGVLHVCL